MTQTLLSSAPRPAAAFKSHVCQRSLSTASISPLLHQRPAPARQPWQSMLEPPVTSSGLDLSMVERDSSTGMWSLSRLGVTLEQEQQSMRQKQDYYLNYGRALRVIREEIPR